MPLRYTDMEKKTILIIPGIRYCQNLQWTIHLTFQNLILTLATLY